MREPITIAYLEDNLEQGEAVAYWLAKQSMQCHVFESVEKMKSAIASMSFDAIMLDVEIDGEALGLTMLTHIRDLHGDAIPVLMVSAESYWQEALGSGADDFLEKPLNSRELMVHIHRLLRPVAQKATIENYPPYQLNTTVQQFTLKGDLVELSEDEYELASTLFRHFGKVLSCEQLLEKSCEQPASRSVRKIESDLLKLKRKMDLRDTDGWRLESVYSHGYRLVNAQYDPAATADAAL